MWASDKDLLKQKQKQKQRWGCGKDFPKQKQKQTNNNNAGSLFGKYGVPSSARENFMKAK